MSRYYPNEPHWYLPLLGVDPLHHGKGFGSALIQQTIVLCDRGNKFAYVESSNPKNIPFYERHRFELLAQSRLMHHHLPFQCFVNHLSYE